MAVDPRQGRTGGSGKVRTLTDEELSLSRVAEENVKRALEQQLKNQLDGIDANGVEYSVIVIIISNEIANDLFFHIFEASSSSFESIQVIKRRGRLID